METNIGKGYIKFRIHHGIQDRVKRFGLEIYDWGIYIFITMVSILVFKKIILIAILLDMIILIFLRNYKKGKPDFYTTSLISYLFTKKEFHVIEPQNDQNDRINHEN